MGLVLLYNTTMSLTFLIKISRRERVKHLQRIRIGLRGVAIFSSMLAGAWVVSALVVVSDYHIVLQVLFVLLAPLQGVFLFVFNLAMHKETRQVWKDSMASSVRKIHEMAQPSGALSARRPSSPRRLSNVETMMGSMMFNTRTIHDRRSRPSETLTTTTGTAPLSVVISNSSRRESNDSLDPKVQQAIHNTTCGTPSERRPSQDSMNSPPGDGSAFPTRRDSNDSGIIATKYSMHAVPITTGHEMEDRSSTPCSGSPPPSARTPTRDPRIEASALATEHYLQSQGIARKYSISKPDIRVEACDVDDDVKTDIRRKVTKRNRSLPICV